MAIKLIVAVLCIPVFAFMGWCLWVDIKDTLYWKKQQKEKNK